MEIMDIIITIFAFAVLIFLFVMSIYMIWRFRTQIIIAVAVIVGIVAICFIIYHIGTFVLSFCHGDDFTAFAIIMLLLAIIGIVWGRSNSKK